MTTYTDSETGTQPQRDWSSDEAPKLPRKKRVWIYVLVGLGILLLVGVLGGIKGAQIAQLIAFGEEAEKSGPPPEVVSTAKVEQTAWERSVQAVGSVVSENGVGLTAEVAGIVNRVNFDSGDTVKRGEVLVTLDADVERAQLQSLKARLDLAQISRQRSEKLAKSGAIPQERADQDSSAFRELTAESQALSAQIARKTIRAPFTGKLGVRKVSVGQYIAPGTEIASLESNEALFIDFDLPQKFLGDVKPGTKVRLLESQDSEEDGSSANNKGVAVEGFVSAVNPSVDKTTRSFTARATLGSRPEFVRPGMFFRVEALLGTSDDAIVVPSTAIKYAPYGDSVFIVNTNEEDGAGKKSPSEKSTSKTVTQQFVKLGEIRGDFVRVLKGVKVGQEVVTAGAFKLYNNAPIRIDNEVKRDPKMNPKVGNR